jgi:hypothetical protein
VEARKNAAKSSGDLSKPKAREVIRQADTVETPNSETKVSGGCWLSFRLFSSPLYLWFASLSCSSSSSSSFSLSQSAAVASPTPVAAAADVVTEVIAALLCSNSLQLLSYCSIRW